MCEAAASKLRDSGTNQVVLTMTVDAQGKVQSFQDRSSERPQAREGEESDNGDQSNAVRSCPKERQAGDGDDQCGVRMLGPGPSQSRR